MVHSLDIRYIDYISTDFRGRFKLLTSFAALQKLAGLPSLALYTLFLPTANRRISLVPRPSYTAADGLHHRYVKRGSGVLVYSFLSRRPGMLGHQSDSRHAIIAYLSYCLKLFVIDDNGGCTVRQRVNVWVIVH